jgi:type VI secretion system protein ImpE
MGYIPTRYPLSENSDDDAIRLARKTEWQEIADNSYSGLGQRVLTTDSADHGILDVRELVIQAPAT